MRIGEIIGTVTLAQQHPTEVDAVARMAARVGLGREDERHPLGPDARCVHRHHGQRGEAELALAPGDLPGTSARSRTGDGPQPRQVRVGDLIAFEGNTLRVVQAYTGSFGSVGSADWLATGWVTPSTWPCLWRFPSVLGDPGTTPLTEAPEVAPVRERG